MTPSPAKSDVPIILIGSPDRPRGPFVAKCHFCTGARCVMESTRKMIADLEAQKRQHFVICWECWQMELRKPSFNKVAPKNAIGMREGRKILGLDQ